MDGSTAPQRETSCSIDPPKPTGSNGGVSRGLLRGHGRGMGASPGCTAGCDNNPLPDGPTDETGIGIGYLGCRICVLCELGIVDS